MKKSKSKRIARIVPRMVLPAVLLGVVPIAAAMIPSLACVPGEPVEDASSDADAAAPNGDAAKRD